MERKKTIALVAHDNMKPDLVEWADWNRELLLCHSLVCTGTTGRMVADVLIGKKGDGKCRLDIRLLKSGPLGGDQQLGAMIAEGRIDALIFFWDPMEAQPHDVDVKALLRISQVYDIPIANNRATADFLITSTLMDQEYDHQIVNFKRNIEHRANTL